MSKIEKITNALTTVGGVLLGGSILFKSCTYTVEAGERAIIFDKAFGGVKNTIMGEGMHFFIPFF